ncbi:energy-coupling factor ABC transporter ATP-binding protein [Clostridium sp.]|uniref:energy-coupling factor ABC transporter ATP-binding protein n=1 Tax=Clostridium sp. TaxID=1506 RepID=UPI002FDD5246
MIDITNVYYSYPGNNALKDINIHIKKGESVVLLGANGSGKSTLLKIINGIISPDRGSYKFNNKEITNKRLQNIKFTKLFHQKIGFVFQNPDTQLFCADVYDEIAFGPRQMGMNDNDVNKRVNDCLTLLNIIDFKYRQPYHLSYGEKRKVSIACVLALNPEVLVLDEPMNGLDPKIQRGLTKLLIKLNKAGKTLITSTHNLELVQEISKRAIVFGEDHRIAADIPTDKLLINIELLKKVNLI